MGAPGSRSRVAARAVLRAVGANAITRPTLLALARTRLLPKAVWKRLPIDRTFRVRLPDGADFRYAAVAAEDIGRGLYWRGLSGFEHETSRVFYDLAARARVVLDIGAHTGLYTLLACAANPRAHVVAFEPVPELFRRLAAQVKLNGWEQRCRLLDRAVSDESGSAQLHLPHGALPTSASLNLEGFRGCDGALIPVELTTVDAVCADEETVDLVKIDVEGFEDAVLRGMQRTLSRFRPAIVVECNPDGPFREVERILIGHGYRFRHLRADGPVEVDRIVPDVSERYRNFLCTAPRPADGFRS